VKTEALQERRGLGILRGPVWWSGICWGGPDLSASILIPPDLCSRILRAPDVSVLWHGRDLCRGILHGLLILRGRFLGILNGLYGLCRRILYLCRRILAGLNGLCPRILLGRPSLELLQRGIS